MKRHVKTRFPDLRVLLVINVVRSAVVPSSGE
jgi:hypothetical protein